MERESMILYKGWYEAISCLSDADRLKCYEALMKYGLFGEIMVEPHPVVNAIFQMAKYIIDSNNEKYDCEHKRIGAPTGNNNNPFGRRGKPKNVIDESIKIKENKENKEINNNINDNIKENVNVNVNVNENEKENKNKNKNANEVKYSSDEHTTLFGESEYSKFCLWLREHAPYLYKNCEHVITEKELDKLLRSYTVGEICEIIVNIENRKDKRKTYTNLYLTAFNWLKREYGKPSERPDLR